MNQVFSKENKTLKKYWKIGKNTGKVREKSGNFVSLEKWEPWSCGCSVWLLANFELGDIPVME